jgi:hypothetical protein
MAIWRTASQRSLRPNFRPHAPSREESDPTRLNATFRARLPALTRRTRSFAQTMDRLRAEMFWSGVVHNFRTMHTSLSATPAMADDLTDHVWSNETR